MQTKIIILGSHKDLHIKSVKLCLNKYNINSHIISYDLPFKNLVSITKSISKVDNFDNVSLVWNRTKLFLPIGGQGNEYEQEYIIKAAWLDYYRFLISYAVCNDIPIVNIYKVGLSTKLISLIVAKSCGLRVPYSIVPSNISQLYDFYKKHGSLIIKVLDTSQIPSKDQPLGETVLMTRRVTKEDIDQMTEEELTICPQLFQQEIKKKIELRVVATKEKIFTYAIDSQKHELTSVDWRHGNSFLPFTPIKEYDEYLFPRIKKYFAKTGLIYGSFDFIVTPENEIYFLECNQEGQWYWLEEQNHEGIPQAIAEAIFMAIPQ